MICLDSWFPVVEIRCLFLPLWRPETVEGMAAASMSELSRSKELYGGITRREQSWGRREKHCQTIDVVTRVFCVEGGRYVRTGDYGHNVENVVGVCFACTIDGRISVSADVVVQAFVRITESGVSASCVGAHRYAITGVSNRTANTAPYLVFVAMDGFVPYAGTAASKVDAGTGARKQIVSDLWRVGFVRTRTPEV